MFRHKKRRLVVVFLLTIVSFIVVKENKRFRTYTSMLVMDVEQPILWLFLRPVVLWKDLSSFSDRFLESWNENKKLRQENILLKKEEQDLLLLKQENAQLRLFLHYRSKIPFTRIAVGQVFSDTHSPFLQTILVNVGQEDHIKPNMIVLDSNNIVGRVLCVNKFSTRVLLLSDPSNRISVTNPERSLHAIFVGLGNWNGELMYVSTNSHLFVGEKIITSGLDGVFPAGLEIGLVSKIYSDHAMVKLNAYLSALSYVQFFSYILPHPLEVP